MMERQLDVVLVNCPDRSSSSDAIRDIADPANSSNDTRVSDHTVTGTGGDVTLIIVAAAIAACLLFLGVFLNAYMRRKHKSSSEALDGDTVTSVEDNIVGAIAATDGMENLEESSEISNIAQEDARIEIDMDVVIEYASEAAPKEGHW